MSLIDYYGKKQENDAGKPGVAEYGSKIYDLRYERLISNEQPSPEDTAIIRKAKVNSIAELSKTSHHERRHSYIQFTTKITGAKYGCLIFDYDGTMCSYTNRFNAVADAPRASPIPFVMQALVFAQ